MGRPATSRTAPVMQKQSIFQSKLLPYVLVAPQLAVVLIFFYWPAAQAVIQSCPAAGRIRTFDHLRLV
jgi:ABC-type sugar transport system permease subunit